jgi:ribosome-associated heat shock protein Hsp15
MTDAIRVDKWLWHARVFKTRNLATKFVLSGRLRVNGVRVRKASRGVSCGDVLTFSLGGRVRVLEIAGLGERRGPAAEAALLVHDRSPREAGPRQPGG